MEWRSLAYGVFSVIAALMTLVIIIQKSEIFDQKVESNQDCPALCRGIGYADYLDLSHEECMVLHPDGRFMKRASGIDAGCCCMKQ